MSWKSLHLDLWLYAFTSYYSYFLYVCQISFLKDPLSLVLPWHKYNIWPATWLVQYIKGITSTNAYCQYFIALLFTYLYYMAVHIDSLFVQCSIICTSCMNERSLPTIFTILRAFTWSNSMASLKPVSSFDSSLGSVISYTNNNQMPCSLHMYTPDCLVITKILHQLSQHYKAGKFVVSCWVPGHMSLPQAIRPPTQLSRKPLWSIFNIR